MSSPKSRAMYGVDVMLDSHFQPKLLEVRDNLILSFHLQFLYGINRIILNDWKICARAI